MFCGKVRPHGRDCFQNPLVLVLVVYFAGCHVGLVMWGACRSCWVSRAGWISRANWPTLDHVANARCSSCFRRTMFKSIHNGCRYAWNCPRKLMFMLPGLKIRDQNKFSRNCQESTKNTSSQFNAIIWCLCFFPSQSLWEKRWKAQGINSPPVRPLHQGFRLNYSLITQNRILEKKVE